MIHRLIVHHLLTFPDRPRDRTMELYGSPPLLLCPIAFVDPVLSQLPAREYLSALSIHQQSNKSSHDVGDRRPCNSRCPRLHL